MAGTVRCWRAWEHGAPARRHGVGSLGRLQSWSSQPTSPAFYVPPIKSPSSHLPAVCLRMQVDPANKEFSGISPERAFADYCLANLVLHLVVWNYMG